MTDNPLPELPDELTARAIELPFELGDEHLAVYRDAYAELVDQGSTTADCKLAGLTAVIKLVWLEHVRPIEQALAESERDVAAAGRALHAARQAASGIGDEPESSFGPGGLIR